MWNSAGVIGLQTREGYGFKGKVAKHTYVPRPRNTRKPHTETASVGLEYLFGERVRSDGDGEKLSWIVDTSQLIIMGKEKLNFCLLIIKHRLCHFSKRLNLSDKHSRRLPLIVEDAWSLHLKLHLSCLVSPRECVLIIPTNSPR